MADDLPIGKLDQPVAGDLPTGTVTFLFTDIVGSTQLLRQSRRGYATVLAEHRRLLRAAFAEHGGREVDTQGDSFFVAFPTTGQAVAAAVQGQRSLVTHPWPDALCVQVRMGLHTGEATVVAGGTSGWPSTTRSVSPRPHRAARSCCHRRPRRWSARSCRTA